MTSTCRPSSLDHVALWVEDRAGLAAFLCDHLGMHVIEETDSFTLVGVDAKLGKLTLFDADGPRERGRLKRVALRADDVESVIERLPVEVERGDDGVAELDAPAGLRLGLAEREGREFDLDHVVLELTEPESAAVELERMTGSAVAVRATRRGPRRGRSRVAPRARPGR